MNENYLLHNETARKLYFEYARNLPIIALCEDFKPSQRVYNNIAEAFLLNDMCKLDAMRQYGIDEKYITGDASDYEKFKAFCSILPKFAGNPIYLLSHIELQHNFDCEYNICEDNVDNIWYYCNKIIETEAITDITLMKQSNLTFATVFYPNVYYEIYNPSVSDLKSFESHLLKMISKADEQGYKIAMHSEIDSFVKPDPYNANAIIHRIKAGHEALCDEYNCLYMQINRILGIEYKKRGWTLLWYDECYGDTVNSYNNTEALAYLESNNALPQNYHLVYIDHLDSEEKIAEGIMKFAKNNVLGKFIFLPGLISPTTGFADSDYIRRIICNIIGRWVENGEYTSDEKILKKLIEDILYNNLKEAIS